MFFFPSLVSCATTARSAGELGGEVRVYVFFFPSLVSCATTARSAKVKAHGLPKPVPQGPWAAAAGKQAVRARCGLHTQGWKV